ncbi:MAG TPA: CehA/McbA family metallohydrolase, partial [Haliangium sp.]|nr:CehA/McbA family metallohydrolase [Haliangium sp.]
RTAVNDYVNLRGVGILEVPPGQDPDIEDGMLCATTYVLPPDSPQLEVHFTLLNPGATRVRGPVGTLSDTGGEVQVWAPEHGFQTSAGLDSLLGGAGTAVPYVIHQGPGVAYGIVPRHPDANTPNATFSVSGVSILLFGATRAVDLFQDSTYQLDLPPRSGATRRVDVIVGRDAADIAARASQADTGGVHEVSGTAKLSDGTAVAGARVGFFRDTDGNGALGPEDVIATYADADDQGEFRASVPAGNYLAVAEVPDVARSAAVAVAAIAGAPPVALSLPAPVTIDYTISGLDGSGEPLVSPMPARLVVIGQHPVAPDRRLFPTSDRVPGAVRVVHAMHGTSMDLAAGSDPPLVLPVRADGPVRYRVEVSRGLEWNTASVPLELSPGSAIPPLDVTLEQALLTPGYVSSEYHVHQIGSPDAAVSNRARIASMLAEGVELFASTDHDFVADLQPLIVELGVDDLVRNIAGIEVTPFAYGHFNAWPIEPDDSPNHGAIDWARGTGGFSMIPAEIFAAMRGRGADVVQINHPRSSAGRSDFQAFFDRAGLGFDLEARQIVTALGPVPNSWLRLPAVSLWSDDFDALEVWNGMEVADSNGDGVRELTRLDLVMRDWFNFLSLGLEVTPVGSSDTHSAFSDTAGMPRTYVRVIDDSGLALQSGAVVAGVLDRLSGIEPRDVVVTNGPFVQVSAADGDASVIGEELAGSGGRVALDVRVTSPAWAAFDTIE